VIKDYLGALQQARSLCDAKPRTLACVISEELNALISAEEARANRIDTALAGLVPLLHRRHAARDAR
jgi:hypothetical protein